MAILTQMVRLLAKQREDLKAFTESLLKDIFKEIRNGKNRIDEPNDNDNINQLEQKNSNSEELQDWKFSAEENFEALEMERGKSESFRKQDLQQDLIIITDQVPPDEVTFTEKTYFKTEAQKIQPKDTLVCPESNYSKRASQKKNGPNTPQIGDQEMQLFQDPLADTLWKRAQLHFLSLELRPP